MLCKIWTALLQETQDKKFPPKLESPVILALGVAKKGETIYPISCPSVQEWAFGNNFSFFHGQIDPTLIFLGWIGPHLLPHGCLFKMRQEKSPDNLRLVD